MSVLKKRFVIPTRPVVLAVLLACGSAVASNEDLAVHHFDLPGQPLQSGLIEFAMQANITIIADNSLIGSYRSAAVSGPVATEAALAQLLVDTPLECRYQSDTDSYILEKKSIEPESQALPAVDFVDEMLVIGQPVYPFRYNTITHTQNQSGRPYYDSSRFLNIIPQQLIKDQQANQLADVVKFSSGITPGDGVADSNDDIFIRGFRRHAIYIDGFRLSSSTGVKMLPANIESVEILKGPSTLLFGQAEPGGIVNVVRKKPQAKDFVAAEVGVGGLGYRDLSLDINRQLPLDEDVDVRLILARQEQAEAGDISDIDKGLAASSLAWKLSPATTLNLGYEYQQADQIITPEVQILRPLDDFAGLKLSDVLRQATPDFSSEFKLFSAEISHYFASDWQLRADYFWQHEYRRGVRATEGTLQNTDLLYKGDELGNDYLLLSPANLMTIPIILDPQSMYENLYAVGKIRSLYDQQEYDIAHKASLTLDGTFSAFSWSHKLALGGRWQRQDVFKEYLVEMQNPFAGQLWDEDEFSDTLSDIAEVLSDPRRPYGDFEERNYWLLYDDYGIFIQDNMEVNDHWSLSAGTGYTITQGNYTAVGYADTLELPSYKKLSSQVGATFKPTANQSFFANYSEAMRANYHVDDIGSQPVDPELSNQIEVGFKGQGMDGRLLSSLAFFSVNKDNIVELAIIDNMRQATTAQSINSKGVDYDFTWQVSSSVDVLGAVSWLKPTIISGANKNNIPALAAQKSASFFIHNTATRQFEWGVGFNYIGKRFADNENKFSIDPYTTIDLNLAYSISHWAGKPKLQLSVKNIMDEQYDTAVIAGVRENPAEGRLLVGKVGVEF
ncbi:MAG TPA: TonB-dependent receptor [Cellvibrio sp.]|nr:TonB-dependent receptor [Cellvibrio sp.]